MNKTAQPRHDYCTFIRHNDDFVGLYHDGHSYENLKNQRRTFKKIAKFTTSLDKFHQVMSLVVMDGRHGLCLWPSLTNPDFIQSNVVSFDGLV